MLKHIWLWGQ